MNISEVLLPMKKRELFFKNIFYRKEQSLVNQMLGSLSKDGTNLGRIVTEGNLGIGDREHFFI